MDTVGIGIVGCGRISDLHARGYRANPHARIAAVCDADPGRARAKAAEWGAARWTTDYRALVTDPGVDAVDVITPQRLHEPVAAAALAAGRHVSIQKPLTWGLQSADRIIAAAAASGRTARLFENFLYHPPLVLARRLIDDGVIGEPTCMRMKFVSGGSGGWDVPASAWAWRAEEHRRGFGMQTFDHGHHLWATAWFLLGEMERVVSWIDSVDGIVDCPAVIMWKHKAPARYGTCDYSHARDLHVPSRYYANDEWFEVTGSRGILLVVRGTGDICGGPPVRVFRDDTWHDYPDVESDWASGFAGSVDNFIDAVLGRARPFPTLEQARHILKFDLAVQESARSGRQIELDGFEPEDRE
jgi:predicted dehydrogenase